MENVVDISGCLSRSTLSPSVFCSVPRRLISEECINQLPCPLASGRLDQGEEPAWKTTQEKREVVLIPQHSPCWLWLDRGPVPLFTHIPPGGESISHSVVLDSL